MEKNGLMSARFWLFEGRSTLFAQVRKGPSFVHVAGPYQAISFYHGRQRCTTLQRGWQKCFHMGMLLYGEKRAPTASLNSVLLCECVLIPRSGVANDLTSPMKKFKLFLGQCSFCIRIHFRLFFCRVEFLLNGGPCTSGCPQVLSCYAQTLVTYSEGFHKC